MQIFEFSIMDTKEGSRPVRSNIVQIFNLSVLGIKERDCCVFFCKDNLISYETKFLY